MCRGTSVYASVSDFSDEVDRLIDLAEKYKEQDPDAALKQLAIIAPKLNSLPLVKRIQYYNVLAQAHATLAQYSLSKSTASKGLNLATELTSPHM